MSTFSVDALPPPPSFCDACKELATLSFECTGCHLINHYCTKISCQTDHWSNHLDDCESWLEAEQDETIVTRLKDGSTWSRKRSRTISVEKGNAAIQITRVPVLDIHSKEVVGASLEGWLAHAGDANDAWHLRYFVIREDVLFCFNDEFGTARGAISLLGFKVRSAEDEIKEKCAIKLYHMLDGRAHFLVAPDKDSAHNWIRALSKSTMPRWGSTILRPSMGSIQSMAVDSLDEAHGLESEPNVRAMPLRVDLDKPTNVMTLKVRLTDYLSDAVEASLPDLHVRNASMKRVLAIPPPYDKDKVRREASEMGGDANHSFNKARFSLFGRKSVRNTSMPSLQRTSSTGSLARSLSAERTDLVEAAASAQSGGSMKRMTGAFGSASSLSSSDSFSSDARAGARGSPDAAHAGILGRRRSVALDVASPVAVAAAMYSHLHSGSGSNHSLHQREGSDASAETSDSHSRFTRSGFLTRIDGPVPTRLYFVLDDDFYLNAYSSEVSKESLLEIDLEGCDYVPEGPDAFRIQQGDRVLRARANDTAERDRWIRVMDNMRDYYLVEEGRAHASHMSSGPSSPTAPTCPVSSANDTAADAAPAAAPAAESDSDDEDDVDEGFSLGARRRASLMPMRRTIKGKVVEEADPVALQIANARLQSEQEFSIALERVTEDLKKTGPAPATDASAPSASPRVLEPVPVYTKPLETPAEIKAAQAAAVKHRMSFLFPHQVKNINPAAGPVAPPKDGKLLNEEEMKRFAVNDGFDKDEERAAPGVVMLAQDDEDIIVQFHMDDSGRVDEYNITAGSLEMLIARLADESHPDTSYIDIFLLSYRHVISASSLMERLFGRFNVLPPPCATPEQLAYYNQWAAVIQVRTVSVVKKWIDNYWSDFANDAQAYAVLMEFLDFAERSSTAMAALTERLRRIVSERQEALRAAELVNSIKEPPKPITMEFTRFEPREFARQLALADHALFVAIAPVEFVSRLWEGNGPQSQRLNDMIEWFNRMSFFTATTIVKQPNVKKRALIVENFVKVLKESHRLKNFNGMMAILSGLNNASVRRLKKTWSLVAAKHVDTLHQMEELMASAYNYRRYRTIIAEIDKEPRPGPIVPFIGLFLRDLTFLNDGNPKKFKGNLINMGKLRMVAQRVLRMQVYQMARYSFQLTRSSQMIKEFLKAPAVMQDENQLYACSLQCEPRENK